ncbi:MAG: hypothetical protein QOF06_535 [Solirubrobacterales bacterium]|jgi:hypothetical protein|nr:hypothetical protein [Solirubrobacterales bacterium]
MMRICRTLLGISLCLGLLAPAAAQGAPPELYRFPQLEQGVLGGQLFHPGAMGANRENGNVYVADNGNARISQYKSEGEFIRTWGWGVVRSGPDDKPGNERQEVTVSAAKGSFRLVFRNFFSQLENSGSFRQPTAPLPFNATAAEVQAALEALETPQPGDVAVTGAAGGPWTIEFIGALADADAGQMDIGESTLKNADDSPGTATVKTLQEGAAFEICEAANGDVCRAGQEDGDSPGQFFGFHSGIAVDGDGDVYVIERNPGESGEIDSVRIEKFSPAGEFLLMLGGEVDKTTGADVCTQADLEAGDECGYGVEGEGAGELSLPPPFGGHGDQIAVGPDGKLYVGDKERIVVYGTDGVYQGEIPVAGYVRALTIDEAGNFYLSYAEQDDVRKLTPAGLPASPASFPVSGAAIGVAVDGLGDVFALENSDCGGCAKYVVEFDSLGNRLLPSAAEVKSQNFFARRKNGFTFDFSLNGLENLLCEGSTGTGVLYVSDGTGNVSGYGEDPQCVEGARPPAIAAQLVRSVGAEGAVIQARINPRRAPTTYYLEYGSADCAANPCTQQPLPPGLLLSTEGNVAVPTEEIELSGLEPGTTYHFRFLAENGEATVGPDRTFTTPRAGAGGLLDGRAWEKVSPAEKGSGQVAQEGGTRNELLQASPDGNAISYPGTAAFGDAPGAPGGNFYLSRRGADAWATRNVTPPRQGGGIQSPMHGFSHDLSHYLMMVEEPPLCCGATPGVANYYLADSAGGPLQLLTATAPLIPPGDPYCLSLGGASSDFSRIFFRAEGALTPESPVGSANLYEWTAADGVQLVSVLPDGNPAPPNPITNFGQSDGCPAPPAGEWRYRAISEDGSRAVWTYGGSYEGAQQPLLARVNGAETVQLDATQGVAGVGGKSNYLGASADGAQVFFTSPERLTPDGAKGNLGDLYRYDFNAPLGERLADLTPGGAPAEVPGALGVAAGGEAIYFVSPAVLSLEEGAALDPKTGQPQVAAAGKANLYLWQAGEGVRFITRLDNDDDFRNWELRPESHLGEVSPDGEHALLLTAEPLTGYENLAADGETRLKEAFLYDAAEDRLTCVSCNPSGAQPRGQAALTPWKTPFEPPRVLSDDGQRVFFESFDALVEGDRNEVRDVYEFERAGTGGCTTGAPSYQVTSEGCLALVSNGAEDAVDSYFLDASSSGDDVFLSTLEQLVGADEDELYDVYDARVGGGLPEPPPPPPGCEGEACRGAGTPPSPGPGPATGTFSGPGNQPRLHCPKGKVARKGRCVNRKTKKHHHRRKHHLAADRVGGNR